MLTMELTANQHHLLPSRKGEKEPHRDETQKRAEDRNKLFKFRDYLVMT